MLARFLKLSNYTYSRGHFSFLFYQERKEILQHASLVNHPQQASTILQENYMTEIRSNDINKDIS